MMLCILAGSCRSQKKDSQSNNNFEQTQKNGVNYFFGRWILKERKYSEGNSKKVYPLHECEKKYTLNFIKENKKAYLTKNYSTGKNCEIKSNSDKFLISVSESSFTYFDLDLKRNEQYKILSKNRFSILDEEILDGEITEIEDVYERL